MSQGINFPIDFERLETTRLLAVKLQASAKTSKELAILTAYRLWSDWFLSGQEHRPLKVPFQPDQAHPWPEEDLSYVLTESTGIENASALMAAAIESGFILPSKDGSTLSLAHFWRYNSHCSPHHKNIQQLGGHAAATARRTRKMESAAGERRLILESQQSLSFGEETPTDTEKDKCLLLIDRLDRACGRSLRHNHEYREGSLLADALRIVRRVGDSEIAIVESYILRERQNPAVVKITERILTHFSETLQKASL